MADLRGGCTSRVRHGGINLGCSRSDGTWWTTDTPSTGAGRGGALRLGAHPIGDRARRIVLRVRCLLRVRVRRGDGKSRRPLAHLVLRSQRLLLGRGMSLLRLLLLLRTLRLALLTLLLAWLRRNETSLATASHDATEKTIARSDRRRLLGGRGMLRRAGNARLDTSLSSSLELVSQSTDLIFISVIREVNIKNYWRENTGLLLLKAEMSLLHLIDLFTDQLHFTDLRGN